MAFAQTVSITETETEAQTTHNISMPETVVEGELLLVKVVSTTASINSHPAGWTKLRDNNQTPVYAKKADGTEGETTIAVGTSSSANLSAQVRRITNWWGDIATGVAIAVATGTSNTPNPPALNPASWGAEDTHWIIAELWWQLSGFLSPYPSGYTNTQEVTFGISGGGLAPRIASAARNLNAASENPGAFSLTGSVPWVALTIAVRPKLIVSVDSTVHGHAAGKAAAAAVVESTEHGHTAGSPYTAFGHDTAHGHTAGRATVVIVPDSCTHALKNTNPLQIPVDSCRHYHAATSPSPGFEPGIKIDVDRARSVAAKYGYGDGRWENIVKDSLRAADFPDDSGLVRKLVAQYRFDGRQGDYLQKELTRDVNPSGREEQVILRHVYDHETADRILSFMAGDFRAAATRLDFEGRRQGVLKKNDRVRVTVPSIGLDSDWQVLDFRTREGAYGIGAKRYDPEKYDYAASPELPEDEDFAVLEEFGETPPDPVANFAVTTSYEVKPDGSVEAYFLATWDPPEENYKEAILYRRKSGDTLWEEIGRGFDRAILSGFVPGLNYDVRIVPWNAAGTTPGTGDVETNITAGGDLANPSVPSGLDLDTKVGRVIAVCNRLSDPTVQGYRFRFWTLSSGGSMISPPGEVFVLQPKDSSAKPSCEFQRQKGDLTGALQTWGEVRAEKYNGRVSAYTSRVSATTGGLVQGDVVDNEITNKVSAFSPSPAVLWTGGNVLISQSITKRAGTKVRIVFSGVLQASTAIASRSVDLKRGVSPLVTKFSSSPVTSGDGDVSMAGVYDDDISSAGTFTYNITVFNTGGLTLPGATPRNFSLLLLELRR